MELLAQHSDAGRALVAGAPPFVARYRPVLWEPLQGTGERVVALLAVQAHESTAQAIAPATYSIIPASRLRAMLGRQRGTAAIGILRECAAFMTQRQQAGMPLEELKPLFRGFELGPQMVGRGWSVQQLLDAAVRSVSLFGTADAMIEEEEARTSPRHMVRTSEFLTALRRIFVGHDKDLAGRFDVPLRGRSDVPDVVIDYAHGPLAVQVTSLPSTTRQAENSEREAQSKMFELTVARSQMEGNVLRPVLLFNTDALLEDSATDARKIATAALTRLTGFARHQHIEVLEAPDPVVAARLLEPNSL